MSFGENHELVFLEAFITGDPSGAIENQEARGQTKFVASDTLPIKCHCEREQLTQMGIVFGEPVDDLFVGVQLPDGWKKVPTNHSMWSELVDDQGRKRASIFYKAAFYDRDAHMSLTRRFSYKVEPICGYSDLDYKKSEWHCVVTDCGEVIWASAKRVEPEPKYSFDDEDSRQIWLNWDKQKEALGKSGLSWLNEHYPNWEDPLAYWD
jgi:hypothetical protein